MEYRTLQHAKLGKGASACPAVRRRRSARAPRAAAPLTRRGRPGHRGRRRHRYRASARDCSRPARSSRPPTWPAHPLDTAHRGLGAAYPGPHRRRAAGRHRPRVGRGGLRSGGARLGRHRPGHPQRRHRRGGAARRTRTSTAIARSRRSTSRALSWCWPRPAASSNARAPGATSSWSPPRTCSLPGANFGAYSSTKAAAHQLARIASLEFAGDDVRVNMVAPDAVFAHGASRSGLWAEVGPDRMKARGLDEAGLEAYYQSRNLLEGPGDRAPTW